ncbi:imidazole glycerol phosphate synthase subunit HisH [Treponema zuelzerae]|uniref:Imidazole glycerol phosphate synthase subunit HisH n=1 Tax=Teretinema zuelzerae TaxID=156 RepID=A0AAE3JKG6_9SPIR|nr:imidazole glycerol phosphate synthase subunit HisH [Teretinema zuelzerae]MCD1655240.1 imidazole glycerol phosphate synthase subunit HisH [Teretinema zuelzerae]
MTGIVDYNAGNIRSVELALLSLGVEYRISKNPKDLEGSDRLIFPGVGEAKFAMQELRKTGFDAFLKDWAAADKPLLGVCLGSQIIFDHSEEGDTACLGLIPGRIRRFPENFRGIGLKVPHMGWNDIAYANGGSPLFDGVPEGRDFYFVHSYYIDPADPKAISATADYGFPVPCAIKRGNLEAVQFHPEKSSLAGLRLLSNFCGKTWGGPAC